MLALLITALLIVAGLLAVGSVAAAVRKAVTAAGVIGRELAALDAPRTVAYRARPVRSGAVRRVARPVAAARLAAA